MKTISIFIISILLLPGCTKLPKITEDLPQPTSNTQTIINFNKDSIELLFNDNKKDSMMVDFDNDNVNDLSIFAYWQHIGVQWQKYYYRLNSLNNNYAIYAEIVDNDTFAVSRDSLIIPNGF